MRTAVTIIFFLAGIFTSAAKKIPDRAHLNDTTLTEITIPADITEIGENAFEGCRNLRKVVFAPGSRLRKINKRAFIWCENLKIMEFPPLLQEIGDHAFAYCSSLKTVTFPASLRKIGMNAFSLCTSLTEIELPRRLTTLDSYAFASCSSLRSARLPASTPILGELIFASCHALMEIEVPMPDPPSFECGSYLFEPEPPVMYDRCVLKVPASSIDKYKSAESWQLFKNIKPI